MKNVIIFIFFLTGPFFLFSKDGNDPVKFLQGGSSFVFTENKGQVSDQNHNLRPDVLFSGINQDLVFHLRTNGISYQISKVEEWKDEFIRSAIPQKIPSKTLIHRIDINWINSNSGFVIERGSESSDNSNYYLQHCSAGILNVKSYNQITYKNIYEGIDLKWYQKDGNLKYDYIVSANADPGKIRMEIKGAKSLRINAQGELVIETELGTIKEKAPLSYQGNKKIESSWELHENSVSFKFGNYNHALPLVIDPVVRIWGTYYGGTLMDYSYALATDGTGNSFIGGFTQSNIGTAMATSGSYQTTFGGGTNDGYIVKFNSNGVRQWGTYFGGTTLDVVTGLATDQTGNIFACGYTDSGNSISTPGSHQSAFGGSVDGFLTKFNTSGVKQWGTYYGGALNDYGYGCATNSAGDVFVCGYTASNTGTEIATASGHQSAYGGASWDAFLAKFNTNGSRLWGTYYGGNGADFSYNCCVDNAGNCYISGKSSSGDVSTISTTGSHQPVIGGGVDAYLAKFNPSGTRLWGTFYGSFGDETGYSCTTDFQNYVYMSGSTDSYQGTTIATTNGHQPAIGGGFGDAYLVKFDNSGVRQWGTYYGGLNYEEGQSCATDPVGNVYMTGQTSSQTGTIMATAGSYQSTFGGGSNDMYLVKFSPNGLRDWATYYGGTGDDHGAVCRTDAAYNIFVTGKTSTSAGPAAIASSNGHQINYGGGSYDGYLIKLFDCPVVLVDLIILHPVSCPGDSDGALTALVAGGGGFTYSWSPTSQTTQSIGGLIAGTYSCVVSNSCGMVATETVILVNPANIQLTPSSSQSIMCSGSSATLNANPTGGWGGYTYTWSTGSNSAATVVSPTANTVYTITVADIYNCTTDTTFMQNVTTCVGIQKNENLQSALIHPNPGYGIYTITGLDLTDKEIVIYNAFGQLLRNPTVQGNSINISNEPAGVYFIRIEKEGNIQIHLKLIKQ